MERSKPSPFGEAWVVGTVEGFVNTFYLLVARAMLLF
jgi:hypothetical protein